MIPIVVLALALGPQSGPDPSPTPAAVYDQEDWLLESRVERVRFEDDGRSRDEESVRLRVLTEVGARAAARIASPFNRAFGGVAFRDVRVRKASGRVVEVPADLLHETTAPAAAAFPVYSDVRIDQLLVPDLQAGDVLEYTLVRTIDKPLAPGQFWFESGFTRTAVALDERIEADVPLHRELRVATAPGIAPEIQDAGDRRIYRVARRNPSAQEAAEARKMARRLKGDRGPDIALSTFRDWAELGAFYAGLERDRRTPTAEIRAKAAELTRAARTPRERIQALYDFVATRIRYVSVSLGLGAVQPHAAAETLAAGYGDCKDKHTLLAALLAAVDVPASAVLMTSYRDSELDVPTLRFDHVITRVEDGKDVLWLDTTTEVAPFQWLSPLLRGKQGLAVLPVGARLERLPEDGVPENRADVELTGSLGADGTLSVHARESYRGDAEVLMRTGFRTATSEQIRQAAEKHLRAEAQAYGLSAELKEMKAGDPADTRQPFVVEVDYDVPASVDLPGGDHVLRLLGGLTPLPRAVDLSLRAPGLLDLGGPSAARFAARITLPTGWRVTVKEPVSVTEDFAAFRSSQRTEDGRLVTERVLEVKARTLPESRAADYDRFQQQLFGPIVPVYRLEKEPPRASALKAACDAGTLESCATLAGRYAAGSEETAKDPATAAILYARACDGGYAVGCGALGYHNELGLGLPKNLPRAAELYARACEGGAAYACTNLAILTASGKGVDRDDAHAFALYVKACDGGDVTGCSQSASHLRTGHATGRDLPRALALYLKACDSGGSNACTEAGRMVERGDAGEKDPARAAALFTRACAGDDAGGCRSLGYLTVTGNGVAKDVTAGASLYAKACDEKDGWACGALGRLAGRGEGVAKDEGRAVLLAAKGCELGDAASCADEGDAAEIGRGVAPDLARAAARYVKACDGGEAWACAQAARMSLYGQGLARDEPRGMQLAGKACDAGSGMGCGLLGWGYAYGHGVEKDPAKGAELNRKSCELHNMTGCTVLAEQYEEGHGVDSDLPEAARLYRMACDADLPRGCGGLGSLVYSEPGLEPEGLTSRQLWQKACDGGDQPSCERLRYAIALIEVSPARDTVLSEGQRVPFVVKVRYEVVEPASAIIDLRFQFEPAVERLPPITPAGKTIERGAGTLTLEGDILVPKGARELQVFVPLMPAGGTRTSSVVGLRYPVVAAP